MSDIQNIDVQLLKEVVDAVNRTTESLKESYALLQKKLEHTQGLLDSVLDNTNSAIIAQDNKNGVFLKKRRAKELSLKHISEPTRPEPIWDAVLIFLK